MRFKKKKGKELQKSNMGAWKVESERKGKQRRLKVNAVKAKSEKWNYVCYHEWKTSLSKIGGRMSNMSFIWPNLHQ